MAGTHPAPAAHLAAPPGPWLTNTHNTPRSAHEVGQQQVSAVSPCWWERDTGHHVSDISRSTHVTPPRPRPGSTSAHAAPVSIYWRSVVLINSREFPSAAWLLLVAGSSEYSHLYPRPSSPGRQLATAVLIKRQIAEIQAERERERVRCVAALVFGFRKKGWFIDVALQLVMAGRLQGGPTARANRRHRRGESRPSARPGQDGWETLASTANTAARHSAV